MPVSDIGEGFYLQNLQNNRLNMIQYVNIKRLNFNRTTLKKKINLFLTATMLIAVALVSTSCAVTKKDLVGVASENAKTLAAAVTAAGMVETLKGTGPFTVFAPTDEAFAAIQSDVDNLLKPENKTQLTKVLTCHVVNGKIMASDLKDG